MQKQYHGVFCGDAVSTINKAWENRTNGYLLTSDGPDVYIIPFDNAGYAGGYAGQRNNLKSITIVTEKGTNKIITGFPRSIYKYTLEGLIGN